MATTDAYSFIARYYDLLIGPLNAALAKIAVRMAAIAPGVRVLDVACGTGSALSEFVNVGAQATFLTNGDLSVSIDYDLEIKEDYYANSGFIIIRTKL